MRISVIEDEAAVVGAALLKMNQNALFRLIKKYGLRPKSPMYAAASLLGIYSARLHPTLIEHIPRKTEQR
jgi:hypothetical protein